MWCTTWCIYQTHKKCPVLTLLGVHHSTDTKKYPVLTLLKVHNGVPQCATVAHYVYHCGTLYCVPLWHTMCTTVAHYVYHCGTLCVPLWHTMCTTVAHYVYHCGTLCVPLWHTMCTTLAQWYTMSVPQWYSGTNFQIWCTRMTRSHLYNSKVATPTTFLSPTFLPSTFLPSTFLSIKPLATK